MRGLLGCVVAVASCGRSSALDVAPNPLLPTAADQVLYELQVRSANACDPTLGSAAQQAQCLARPRASRRYEGLGQQCDLAAELARIRPGLLDDLGADTADFREGITLRYVRERVGATMVWFMPIFPANDQWEVSTPCDYVGSPYAVQDYFHVSGLLARACVAAERDERDATPCWGDDAFDDVIRQAHARGLKVMLDVALNHLGTFYEFYDYDGAVTERDRLARGEDLSRLWDFAATEDPALLHPALLDTPSKLDAAVARDPVQRGDLAALRRRCPLLVGQRLVAAYGQWRIAFDDERATFPCAAPNLDVTLPRFFLGADGRSPSTQLADVYPGPWPDVKFLFHRGDAPAHAAAYARVREYLFRILNYWTARGVDGFRLDHATNDRGVGILPRTWKYLTTKVAYYAARRGQATPMFLAEAFHDHQGIAGLVDAMTEGYTFDITGRGRVIADIARLEEIVTATRRFGDRLVVTAIENHDEPRLASQPGFDVDLAAGLWGLGATTRSVPMLLMGQEFGETRQLAFRRPELLRRRFAEDAEADALRARYQAMITARLAHPALRGPHQAFLRAAGAAGPAPDLYAAARWTNDGDVMFVFHNVWRRAARARYVLDAALAGRLGLRDAAAYRLVDVLSPGTAAPCQLGATLRAGIDVELTSEQRARWLHLEPCAR